MQRGFIKIENWVLWSIYRRVRSLLGFDRVKFELQIEMGFFLESLNHYTASFLDDLVRGEVFDEMVVLALPFKLL